MDDHNLVAVFLVGSLSIVQKVEGASRKGTGKAASVPRVQFRYSNTRICINFQEHVCCDILRFMVASKLNQVFDM